jgi:excisionase family DNA binding protein
MLKIVEIPLTFVAKTLYLMAGGDAMKQKLYSVLEASEAMGISEQRVRKLLSEGRIEAIKVGKTWAITKLGYERKQRGFPKRK